LQQLAHKEAILRYQGEGRRRICSNFGPDQEPALLGPKKPVERIEGSTHALHLRDGCVGHDSAAEELCRELDAAHHKAGHAHGVGHIVGHGASVNLVQMKCIWSMRSRNLLQYHSSGREDSPDVEITDI
jgi:hypothetical protein